MEKQLDKIEDKLDKLHDKLDAYNGRIVHLETSQGFIKWGLSILITVASSVAVMFAKIYKG